MTLLRKLDAACTSADELAEAAVEMFEGHPDSEIITSFPGIGSLTGARILAEIGDDPSRFADARALKSYAGAAPVTRASGKSTSVKARRINNQHLAAAGYIWAFASLTASPGARVHYDRRRTCGDRHISALRNLINRMIGCLHHCFGNRVRYDETIAFPTQPELGLATAA
ncbi:transposase [Streptomyces umbrinus]